VADFDRIRAHSPGWAVAPDLMAKMAVWHVVLAPADRRDPAKGLDLARRAAARDPRAPLYRVALGVALVRSGRPAEAVCHLEHARQIGGGRLDDLAYPALTLAYLALGHREQAAEAFRQGEEAGRRLAATRLPEYLRDARALLEAEAAAVALTSGWLTPR
jgi:hypothetical protein